MDQGALDRDVAGAADAHQRLLAHLDDLRDRVQSSQPSLLPGWTVGHVLTHLARNADSHVRMLEGLPQYDGGAAGRAADIDAGAGRPFGDLVDDVRRTIWRLEGRWAQPVDWDATADRLAGPGPMTDLPFVRWREVEVHRADLGAGYTFADMPALYVRLELRRMEMMWQARRPMGLTALPERALALAPHDRLAWLMGRLQVNGLDPAGVF